MINIGLIGVGYWGPNLIQNFVAHPNTQVQLCCDLKSDRLDFIKNTYPFLQTTKNYAEVVKDPSIDLVAICTPVSTHYEIAKKALKEGKHVLIEKPMTSTAQQAEELLNIAEQKNLKIFVDHTFIYSGAVRKIKELIDNSVIGDLYYFDSVRVNLGLFQHDVNVIWDLAPHDISIMHFLFDKTPERIVATGAGHLYGKEDVAYLTIYYPENLIAHISWLSPIKIRQTLIAGSKKMIVWDDNQPSEKVRIYDKGVDMIKTKDQLYETSVQYRTGDMYCPKLDSTEALSVEVDHILNCIIGNGNNVACGNAELMVVKTLEAAQE